MIIIPSVQKTELGFKVSSSPSPYFAKFRLNNDTMEGFQRFESSDDCGDEKCSYIFKVFKLILYYIGIINKTKVQKQWGIELFLMYHDFKHRSSLITIVFYLNG